MSGSLRAGAPDWDYWLKRDDWSLWEACNLAMDRERRINAHLADLRDMLAESPGLAERTQDMLAALEEQYGKAKGPDEEEVARNKNAPGRGRGRGAR